MSRSANVTIGVPSHPRFITLLRRDDAKARTHSGSQGTDQPFMSSFFFISGDALEAYFRLHFFTLQSLLPLSSGLDGRDFLLPKSAQEMQRPSSTRPRLPLLSSWLLPEFSIRSFISFFSSSFHQSYPLSATCFILRIFDDLKHLDTSDPTRSSITSSLPLQPSFSSLGYLDIHHEVDTRYSWVRILHLCLGSAIMRGKPSHHRSPALSASHADDMIVLLHPGRPVEPHEGQWLRSRQHHMFLLHTQLCLWYSRLYQCRLQNSCGTHGSGPVRRSTMRMSVQSTSLLCQSKR